MYDFKTQWINDTQGASRPESKQAPARDAELLDAYSQAVVRVVRQVGPAVVTVGEQGRGGVGSGFLITPDGFALTNSHVVGGRAQLRVSTEEGDKLAAEVVGDDPGTDLALLRLASRDLPFIELDDTATLQVGQLAIAVGNPFGF